MRSAERANEFLEITQEVSFDVLDEMISGPTELYKSAAGLGFERWRLVNWKGE